MEISGIISSIRLIQSMVSEQESMSEARRKIFDSVAGQEISFTPEIGEEIQLQLRNCAFDSDENITHMTVSVSDPNRPDDLFQLETDIRYHFCQMYMKRSTGQGNPLIKSMNFVELGPEDFKVELGVESTDPPTLQLYFERIEKVLSQIHTEYHQFLRSMYEEYKQEFDVIQETEDDQIQYSAKSDLNRKEMVPQPGEHEFEIWTMDGDIDMHDRIMISDSAYNFVQYAVAAEAGEDAFFNLTYTHR